MVFLLAYRFVDLSEVSKKRGYDERFHVHSRMVEANSAHHHHHKKIDSEDLILPDLNTLLHKKKKLKMQNQNNIDENSKLEIEIEMNKNKAQNKENVNNYEQYDNNNNPNNAPNKNSVINVNIKDRIVQKDPNMDPFLVNLERIIHIDLKGAPPKPDYFKQFIPFLKEYGADGILLEFEDTFPFEGELAEARHKLAYSLNDVQLIKNLAKENGLYIIPLVQTYGHLEWLLKVKKFAHLREADPFPQVISPCIEESYTVLYGI